MQKGGWLEHAERHIAKLESDLERRPEIARRTYRILTLGVKATGKTSLTLKWSNPLIDLGTMEGTKIERYERTVSQVRQKDLVTEHVFEVHDWGGEHIVDAQQELIVEEVNGLLIVVDLGNKGARQADMARIQEQLDEFQPQALKYFFGPKTVASCKSVVLFINKSDLLAGTPAQVEEQAKKLYAPLIDNLNRWSTQIDVRVFVGSASYGHSTHLLFSHFVERILPRSAYDPQLLQRMKNEFSAPQQMPPSAMATPLPMPLQRHSAPPMQAMPMPPMQRPSAPPSPVAPLAPIGQQRMPSAPPAASRAPSAQPEHQGLTDLHSTAPLLPGRPLPPIPRRG